MSNDDINTTTEHQQTEQGSALITGSTQISLGQTLGPIGFQQMFSAAFLTSRSQISYEHALSTLSMIEENPSEPKYSIYKAVALINILEILTQKKEGRIMNEKNEYHVEQQQKEQYETFVGHLRSLIELLTKCSQEEVIEIQKPFPQDIHIIIDNFAIASATHRYNTYPIDIILSNGIIGDREKLETAIKDITAHHLHKNMRDVITRILEYWGKPIERGEDRDEKMNEYLKNLLLDYIIDPTYEHSEIKISIYGTIQRYNQIIEHLTKLLSSAFDGEKISDIIEENDNMNKIIDELLKKLLKAKPQEYESIIKETLQSIVASEQ